MKLINECSYDRDPVVRLSPAPNPFLLTAFEHLTLQRYSSCLQWQQQYYMTFSTVFSRSNFTVLLICMFVCFSDLYKLLWAQWDSGPSKLFFSCFCMVIRFEVSIFCLYECVLFCFPIFFSNALGGDLCYVKKNITVIQIRIIILFVEARNLKNLQTNLLKCCFFFQCHCVISKRKTSNA